MNQIVESKLNDTLITLIIDIFIFILTSSFIKLKSRFFRYLFIFIFISSISYIISDNFSLIAHINGIRETLVFICYFVIFDVLYRFKQMQKINERFKAFAYFFLVIQIPVSILQFIEFGPGDKVGGTYGEGGSGLLTLSIFLLIYYLIENKVKSTHERLKIGLPFIVFLFPIALNETKISFILLFLFFLSFVSLKKIGTSIFVISLGIISFVSFSFIYSTQENVSNKNPLLGIFNGDYLENYLNGEIDEYYDDIPRFTKLAIGTQKLSNDNDLLLGKDYGAFMGSQLKISSGFSKKNEWLLRGSKPYSFYLLISGGVFLLILVISMIFSEIFRNQNNYSSSLLFFLTAIFIGILFYNDGLRSTVFSFIFVFILFFSKQFKKLRIPKLKKFDI